MDEALAVAQDLADETVIRKAERMDTFLTKHAITELRDVLRPRVLPSIAFSLEDASMSRSRVGGGPLLPPGFDWPVYTAKPVFPEGEPPEVRKLDFLLQIDLSELATVGGPSSLLPSEGLLTFFYDLKHQPWGYDPATVAGSRVVLVPDQGVSRAAATDLDHVHSPAGMNFRLAETLPSIGSRAWDALEQEAELPDSYFDFLSDFEQSFYPPNSGLHRLFGHSANVQGDMQLEAQLVSNGLYCGDSSAYQDPRREALEPGAADWILLLQLDSDDSINMMWGDLGMLYFWIKANDLAARRFDRAWMALQCG